MKENKVIQYVWEVARKSPNCDLNMLWQMVDMKLFTLKELRDFYIAIGLESMIDDIERFNQII